jgi:hypothetical protein
LNSNERRSSSTWQCFRKCECARLAGKTSTAGRIKFTAVKFPKYLFVEVARLIFDIFINIPFTDLGNLRLPY